MSKASQPGSQAVLGAKEAASLIATIRTPLLVSALKHPDFAMVVAVAFSGFRFDGNGLANPLVRRRLAEEASRNPHFAQKLRELGEQAQAQPLPKASQAERIQPQVAPNPGVAAQPAPDRSAEKYREERDRLKQEASDDAKRRRDAERDLGQAKLELLAATNAKTELERDAMRSKLRAERLERKLRRLELENAQLRRLAGAVLPSTPARRRDSDQRPVSPESTESNRTDSPFANAVRRLLDKQRWQAARALSEDVLRAAPNNEAALAIHAAACEPLGDARATLHDLRMLVSIQTARADMAAAAKSLSQLFVKSDSQETKIAREFFQAAGGDPAGIRDVIEALRLSSPIAYEALREAAAGWAGEGLFSSRPAERASADEALPIALAAGLPNAVTGRLAATWIDRNEIATVNGLRAAVAAADPHVRTRLAAALEAATDGDGSYFRLLTLRNLAGPVVVDASNAAWSGQEMMASPRPRLGQVQALRRALREKGYFPAIIIGDANFPFVVDDPITARKLVADGQIALATGGTDADVLILQEAKRLHAAVVSNDYMTEWDPGQDVPKLQFTVAPTTGEVTIYR